MKIRTDKSQKSWRSESREYLRLTRLLSGKWEFLDFALMMMIIIYIISIDKV